MFDCEGMCNEWCTPELRASCPSFEPVKNEEYVESLDAVEFEQLIISEFIEK